MPKLSELEAVFVQHLGAGSFREVDTFTEANGVLFDCPKCRKHRVLVWDRSVGAGVEPGPGRWTMTGTSLHDLTLSPSVNLSRSGAGCLWHGWVRNGEAV